MHFYQHHIGDFIKATARLTDGQAMTYLRMIWAYYDDEKPFDNDIDAIAFRVGADRDLVLQLVKHFFEIDGNLIRHRRCDEELEGYKAKSEGGKKGAAKRWGNKVSDSIPMGNPLPTQCDPNANHKPLTNNHVKKKVKRKVDDDPYFDMFWTTYDYKIDKAKAMKSWEKINPDGELAMKICQAADRYVIATPDRAYRRHPTTWLNNRSWENEVIDKRYTASKPSKHATNPLYANQPKTEEAHHGRIIDATPLLG